MIYVKHPVLGNKHARESEQSELEAAGWVRWPRSKEQKAGVTFTAADGDVVKRKPGRPKKAG